MQHPQLKSILQAVKDHLSSYYRERLKALILYGSQAREESHEFSDIDILVVLKGSINPYQEIDNTSQFIAQISLEHDVLISRHFVSFDKFDSSDTPFLHNVKAEGVWL
ncbi:nucleotidyltransferase domain-containing protein [Romeria aff. gracilis LEGE 07310]|uniref:Nucleotidyltransferase domain-containing protein n=1 Tax=Vasconcelosia minhoensis LEGE 07310 TaxID=915328 RepID=A0A8J7AGF5_9CYAN|nr:nucleotidyltransferase domain-containing protein [Romeria gracilis]MBE9078404.1 nucleotidyltransferase domain-containing protein [Romeria aff. gracilis LEGE 07310]